MTLSRNLLAGLAGSVCTALVGLVAVPFYLKYLGIEAYGLVGFFSTLQALFQILDLGLSPTMNREVARHAAVGHIERSGRLLHTLALFYWGAAVAIGLTVFATAAFIASDWLHPTTLASGEVYEAVALMGLIIACRWPIALYMGALMGAQRQTVSSAINVAMMTMANGGAICVLAFVSPTIHAFFLWQAAVGLLHAFVMRRAAWRVVGRSARAGFDFEALRQTWGFSAGMIGVAVTALVFTQLDKILLSRILSLSAFGEYTLATVVATSLGLLSMPVFNVVYPRFSALVTRSDAAQLVALYHLSTRFLATVLFSLAMFLAVFGEQLVALWTGNPPLAARVAPLIAVIVLGSAAHNVMQVPYALQLAFGNTKLPLLINLLMMTVMIPATISLALTYGALGGALAWLILHTIYLFLGTWLTHRQLLIGAGKQWLLGDVGVPAVLTLCIGLVAKYGVHDSTHSTLVKLAYGGMLAILAVFASVGLSSSLRTAACISLGAAAKGPPARQI